MTITTGILRVRARREQSKGEEIANSLLEDAKEALA